MEKAAWRARLRAVRRQRSEAQKQAAADGIAWFAVEQFGARHWAAIGAFISTPTEVPTNILLRVLSTDRIVVPDPGPDRKDLLFVEHSHDFSAEQPDRLTPQEALADVELMFVPALAVDRSGTRLGQGGGWYDRVLEFLPPSTPVYAVVFDDEVLDAKTLPFDLHDRPVTGALTPSGLIQIGRQIR
jgi:5-formyltetrahydrofolate cyclo-ligase